MSHILEYGLPLKIKFMVAVKIKVLIHPTLTYPCFILFKMILAKKILKYSVNFPGKRVKWFVLLYFPLSSMRVEEDKHFSTYWKTAFTTVLYTPTIFSFLYLYGHHCYILFTDRVFFPGVVGLVFAYGHVSLFFGLGMYTFFIRLD